MQYKRLCKLCKFGLSEKWSSVTRRLFITILVSYLSFHSVRTQPFSIVSIINGYQCNALSYDISSRDMYWVLVKFQTNLFCRLFFLLFWLGKAFLGHEIQYHTPPAPLYIRKSFGQSVCCLGFLISSQNLFPLLHLKASLIKFMIVKFSTTNTCFSWIIQVLCK